MRKLTDIDHCRGKYSSISNSVKYIDLSNFSEPINKRDHEWIKKAMKKITSGTGSAGKYDRSGNYTDEDEFLEWLKFCEGSPSWTKFKAILSDKYVLIFMLKK
jgi:ketol-acid reductoisomerase